MDASPSCFPFSPMHPQGTLPSHTAPPGLARLEAGQAAALPVNAPRPTHREQTHLPNRSSAQHHTESQTSEE